ncbi:MAG: efflux RND transporter periplasmic adaptor subunit [Bermanella sp.]
MRLNRIFKASLLLGSLSLLSACGDETQIQSAPPAANVSVAPVIHQRITEWDEFTGRLEAPESVSLRPRISGFIDSIAFKEGSLVNEGDVLFNIDRRPFSAEVRRLTAELEDAKSRLNLAKSSYKRANELSSKNAISIETFDSSAADLEQANARLRSVTAALEVARLNLGYTKITAPISGRISRAMITKGNLVAAGNTLLTTIVSVDKVYAYFDADEKTFLKYMQLAKDGTRPSSRDVKNPVYMSLANDTDYPHEGYIDFIDNQVNPTTGTIRGRAVFDNSKGDFIPGLFARIKLIGSAPYEGILINDKAINTDLKNKFVLVLDKDNNVQYRAIEMGEKLNGLRIIKSGLSPNESIVVNGLQRVRPGSPTTPTVVPMADQATLALLQAQQSRIDDTTARLTLLTNESANDVVGG